ncbi:MAG: glycosyltransferase [Wenyingzhuangia sp.]|jgi:glycosyltransferase involved in cell wall biosynthesis
MKFLIISNAPTLLKDGKYYGYGPYAREMNIWAKNKEVAICSPYEYREKLLLDEFNFDIKVFKLYPFSINGFKNLFKSLIIVPVNMFVIFKAMLWANHIHLRCPGNVGLLGGLIQILFPSKSKTAKYAGNWDPESKQPVSYNIQKWILSNTFLTKNMKVLVYGEWPNQTKNILPFFTATYAQNEIINIPRKQIASQTRLIFVGALTKGKQPMLSIKVAHHLLKKGYDVRLDIYGEGNMRYEMENYIASHQLDDKVILHGNVDKELVKKAFQVSHFLIFISKSEGWPKVVAEAMFWNCLPITSKVSCVPYMLGDNTRGKVVASSVESVLEALEGYLSNHQLYVSHIKNAEVWSRAYTLEKFELEIEKLVYV